MEYSLDQMLENYEFMSHDSCKENLQALSDKLKELEDKVSGLSTSIRDFVCDDKGRVVEDKVHKLVDEMLQSYYKKNPGRAINDAGVRWLKLFIYLGLTTFKRGEVTPYEMYNDLCSNETFGDILKMAKTLDVYSDERQLLEDELDFDIDFGGAKGVWEFFDRSYSMLTGESVTKLYPAEEVEEIVARRLGEYEDEQSETECDDEDSACDYDEYEDDLDDYYDPEYMEYQRQFIYETMIAEAEERERQLTDNWNNWRNSLIDTQMFIDRYLEFRQLFFQTSVSYDTMRECMTEYLYSKGKCLLGDGFRMHMLMEALDSLMCSYGKP